MQKSVSQQPLSCIKEGWEQQTSNKFQTSEQFHPISFQDGGTDIITKYAPEARLHVQAEPKRQLLLCFSKKGIKEIYMVSVGRDTLRVPLSLFWSRSSSSNIYQNFKGTNFPLQGLQIRVIIYLEDVLLMSQTLEELLMSRDK